MSDPARPRHIDFSGFEAALRRPAAERAQAARTPTDPTALASGSRLTEVELTWIEKRLEHWIRFGRIAQDRILTRKTRVIGFRPGAIFAFVRWSANDYGTVVSRIDVVRAVAPGTYTHPQAFVEDMYRPDRFGRTATGKVEVTAGK